MIRNTLRQKGAILVLTALALPMLICATGLAVDFGNIYIHHAALQNSADAAALGGAKVGYTTKFNKANADKEASALIKENQHSKLSGSSFEYKNSKSDPTHTHYYVVTLTEDVPLYFLRYIGLNDKTISATANAKIHADGNSPFPLFSNLITFQDSLYINNSNVSPNDKTKLWNGRIIHTTKNPYIDIKNDITKDGSNQGLLHTVDEKGNEQLLDPRDNKYYDSNIAVPLEDSKNTVLKNYVDKLQAETKPTPCPSQTLSSKDLQAPVTYIYDADHNKRMVSTINLDSALGNSNSTHVLIITEGAVNLNLTADTVGKLIIIDLSTEQLAINGGGTMHAVIYAPNSKIVWNPNNLTFYGSIVSKKIEIQSSKASFSYEKPSFPDNPADSSSASDVSLSNDDDIAS
jgi:hypothetical protein